MARGKGKDKEEKLTEEQENNNRVAAFLNQKEVRDLHFNFEESVDYQVSTGSLTLDSELGTFGAGLHRFFGPTESGKTSQALVIMKNMLENVEGAKGLYVKAEGRFSKDIQERSGIKFVTDPTEWVAGTCLVLKCNVSEIVFKFVQGVIADIKYKDGTKICCVLDSTDGLITKNAMSKDYGEAAQVAAGANQASLFCKLTSLPAGERGHMIICLSQLRDTIRVDQRTPMSKQKQAGGSGGNALMHYPDHIWEYMRETKDDIIMPDDGDPSKASMTNQPIGKYAKFKTLKTPNEKTGIVFYYPIKRGRTGGKSIWVEREVVDFMIAWEHIEKKSSWFTFQEELMDIIREVDPSLTNTIKLQGSGKVYKWFEERPEILKHLYNYALKKINLFKSIV